MKPLERFTLIHYRHFESKMEPDPAGEWIRFADLTQHYMDFVEDLCLGWNSQLISGGALNETEDSNGESKV